MLFRLHGLKTPCLRWQRAQHLSRNCLARASTIRKAKNPHNVPPPRTTSAQPTKPIRPEDHQEPLAYRPPGRPTLPGHIQIYHAGAVRTSTIAIVKVTNLLFLTGVCTYGWVNGAAALGPGAAVALASLVWTTTFAYISAPFVVSLQLRLPTAARAGSEALLRWAKAVPADAMLDIRTMRLHGGSKTSGVRLNQLRTLEKRWWRIANLEKLEVDRRGALVERPKKRWWRPLVDWTGEPRNKFYVDKEGRKKGGMPVVLEALWKQFERQPERRRV